MNSLSSYWELISIGMKFYRLLVHPLTGGKWLHKWWQGQWHSIEKEISKLFRTTLSVLPLHKNRKHSRWQQSCSVLERHGRAGYILKNISLSFRHFTFIFYLVCAMHTHVRAPMWRLEVSWRSQFLPLPWGFQGLNSGCEVWLKAPLPAILTRASYSYY